MSTSQPYQPHPHIAARKKAGPPKTGAAALPASASWAAKFNAKLAIRITAVVGTMWCAYGFAALAFTGFPGLLGDNVLKYVLWTSTIFLQLVLLSVIMVGQNIQSAASDKRAEATYNDADAVLHTSLDIQAHLEAQDAEMERILAEVRLLTPAARKAPAKTPAKAPAARKAADRR